MWLGCRETGKKDPEAAEVWETCGAFHTEGLSFHQMMSELFHKRAFVMCFTKGRMTIELSSSGEV